MIAESLTWFSSQTRCQQVYPGAYLLVILDASEQNDLNNYIIEAGSKQKLNSSCE